MMQDRTNRISPLAATTPERIEKLRPPSAEEPPSTFEKFREAFQASVLDQRDQAKALHALADRCVDHCSKEEAVSLFLSVLKSERFSPQEEELLSEVLINEIEKVYRSEPERFAAAIAELVGANGETAPPISNARAMAIGAALDEFSGRYTSYEAPKTAEALEALQRAVESLVDSVTEARAAGTGIYRNDHGILAEQRFSALFELSVRYGRAPFSQLATLALTDHKNAPSIARAAQLTLGSSFGKPFSQRFSHHLARDPEARLTIVTEVIEDWKEARRAVYRATTHPESRAAALATLNLTDDRMGRSGAMFKRLLQPLEDLRLDRYLKGERQRAAALATHPSESPHPENYPSTVSLGAPSSEHQAHQE
ncbi:hypothetical protein MRY87_04210 [bacterium]|nr:hypothetical protein [bacterium]